ncbi:transcription factor [Schizosaccharomyces cryophilus OY26]|uniref:Transcription factor n=1 Tax=Schizosaccharomyces cryophilus (strain OY26 / ATCC MYA-4695 / CBS 11777 / NBRC 106824 / NRRL Y48691) TaxID=653667 RepID=S9VTL3_SCHCR|nr:transcription factor [Schizosaccharomyces cryophilus OY26]EPY49489.1 transcription factor [Schizosaccharomyces cryophilus OY26]
MAYPEGENPQTNENKLKKRINRACDLCRKRKIRCDGKQPTCRNCLNHNVSCIYTARPKRRTGQKQIYVKSLVSRLEQMESTLRSVIPNYTPENESVPNPNADAEEAEKSYKADSSSDESASDDLAFLNEKMGMLITTPIGNQKYIGASSTLSILQHATKFASGIASEKALENLSLAKSGCLAEQQEDNIDANREELPPPEVAQAYIDAYFNTFNSEFPIFTKESFDKRFGSPDWYKRQDGCLDVTNYALYVSVLCLGCIGTGENECNLKRAKALYMNVLDVKLEVTRFMSFDTLLVSFLSSIFFSAICQPNSAWLSLGVVIRVAQTLGLHRNSAMWCINKEDAEEKARVFWLIYSMDRLFSFTSGKPLAFQDEDIDQIIPFYSIYDFSPVGNPRSDELRKYNFLECVVRLMQVYGRILRQLYSVTGMKSTTNDLKEKIKALDLELHEWLLEVPESIRPVSFSTFSRPSSHLLAGGYYAALILLHRHALTKNLQISCTHRGLSNTMDSQALCIQGARAITYLFSVSLHGQEFSLKVAMYHAFTATLILFIGILKRPLASSCREDINCLITVKRCFLSCVGRLAGYFQFSVTLNALDSIISTAELAVQKAQQMARSLSTPFDVQTDVAATNESPFPYNESVPTPPSFTPNPSQSEAGTEDVFSGSNLHFNHEYLDSLNNSFLEMQQNKAESREGKTPNDLNGFSSNDLVAGVTPILDQTLSMYPFNDELHLDFSAANVYNPNMFEDMGLDFSMFNN